MYTFSIYTIISSIWSVIPKISLLSGLRFLSFALFSTVVWDIFDTKYRINIGIQSLIIGGYIPAVFTIISYFTSSGSFRQAALGYNVNYLAGNLAVLLPISIILYKWDYMKYKYLKLLNALFVPITILAIIITGSRMGIIALAPTLILLIVILFDNIINEYGTKYNTRGIIRSVSLIAILTIASINTSILNEDRLQYYSTIPGEILSGDFGGVRGQAWSTGIDYFINSPFIGYGSRSFGVFVENVGSAHNTYIQILFDLGLIGLVIYLSMLYLVFDSILNNKYKVGWASFFFVVLIIYSANNFEYKNIIWILFTLCIRFSTLLNWEPRKQDRSI